MFRPSLGGLGWRVIRSAVMFLSIVASIFVLYIWHLGSLTPGLSVEESASRSHSQSFSNIANDPVNAPHKLIQYGLQSAGQDGAFGLRLPSVIFALIFTASFYLLVRSVYGNFIGTVSTLLLATTPWLLIIARSASPVVLLLTPLVIMLIFRWLQTTNTKHNLAWFLLITICAVCLYIPGLFLLILVGIAVAHRQLFNSLRKSSPWIIAAALLATGLLLTPLALAIAKDWTLVKVLVLWPDYWPALVESLKSTGWAASSIFWRSREHMDLIIGRLPILDITQIVLSVFGMYSLWTKARRPLYGLLIVILVGVIGAGINQDLGLITLALPAFGVLIAAGVYYLYEEWRKVFPRNPLPQALAIALIASLVVLHVVFGVRYALVAWPNTIDTRHSYMLK